MLQDDNQREAGVLGRESLEAMIPGGRTDVGEDKDGAEEMKRVGHLEGTLNTDDQLHMVGEEEEDASQFHSWMDGSGIH